MYNIKIFSIKHMNQKHTASILDGFLQAFTKYDCLVGSQPLQESHNAWKRFRPILMEF